MQSFPVSYCEGDCDVVSTPEFIAVELNSDRSRSLQTVGTVLTSYAKPRTAMTMEIYRQDWPTIGERTERFVLLLAGLALASVKPTIGGVSTIGLMLWLTVVMTHVGAIQRILYTRRRVQEEDAVDDGT